MEKKTYKQLLIPVIIIAVFIFIVSFASLYTQRHISCRTAQTCTLPIPFLIPITSSIGLFIGTLVYYLMAGKITQKDTDISRHDELIENMLNKEEKTILKSIANQDSPTQAKITSAAGLPRVKVFRTIEKLKKKGIVQKHEDGKARIISIRPEYREIFKR